MTRGVCLDLSGVLYTGGETGMYEDDVTGSFAENLRRIEAGRADLVDRFA